MTGRAEFDEGRYVRQCQAHKTVLRPEGDGFACTRCGGRVAQWDIVDLKRNRVVDVGMDEVLRANLDRRGKVVQASPAVATAPTGEERIRSAGAVGSPKPNSHRVLAAAKFMDAAGAALFVKLLYRAWAVPFAVEWESRPKAGKKTAGRCAQTIDEAEAQRHYLAAIRDALGAGWTRVNKRCGSGRGMAMLPIPAPPSAAAPARRGKAA